MFACVMLFFTTFAANEATRQVAVSLATRQVAYFSSPYFRRIIIHTLETKFVYG